MQINYRLSKQIETYISYRQKNFSINNTSDSRNTAFPDNICRQNIRLHISYKVNENWTFRNRLEFVKYNKFNILFKNGFLFYQDIIFKSFSKIALSLRYAVYDTDDYDTRIYAYENDVLYYYYIPFYYNKGTRFYFNLNYKINSQFAIWLRYGQTYFDNKNVISQGYDQIEGSVRSEFKAQLQIKF